MTAATKAAAPVRYLIPSEKSVQIEVISFWKGLGFDVISTSQYRASGLVRGLPDLIGFHLTAPLSFYFETKRPARRTYRPFEPSPPEARSPEQVAFGERLTRGGHTYGWGGVREAWALAGSLGLVAMSGASWSMLPLGRELVRQAVLLSATRGAEGMRARR